jgi:hypothetical protein
VRVAGGVSGRSTRSRPRSSGVVRLGEPASPVEHVALQQAKNDCMAALSPQTPTRPMDVRNPAVRLAAGGEGCR